MDLMLYAEAGMNGTWKRDGSSSRVGKSLPQLGSAHAAAMGEREADLGSLIWPEKLLEKLLGSAAWRLFLCLLSVYGERERESCS